MNDFIIMYGVPWSVFWSAFWHIVLPSKCIMIQIQSCKTAQNNDGTIIAQKGPYWCANSIHFPILILAEDFSWGKGFYPFWLYPGIRNGPTLSTFLLPASQFIISVNYIIYIYILKLLQNFYEKTVRSVIHRPTFPIDYIESCVDACLGSSLFFA